MKKDSSHPAWKVSKENYREQLFKASTLHRDNLWFWLKKLEDANQPLAGSVQLRLTKRKNRDVNQALAYHPYILPEVFDVLLAKDTAVVLEGLTANPGLTLSMIEQLFDASFRKRELGNLYLRDDSTPEFRSRVKEKVRQLFNDQLFAAWCYTMIKLHPGLPESEFDELAEKLNENTIRHLLGIANFPQTWINRILIHGTNSEKFALSFNRSLSEQDLKRFSSYSDPELYYGLTSQLQLPVVCIEKILAETTPEHFGISLMEKHANSVSDTLIKEVLARPGEVRHCIASYCTKREQISQDIIDLLLLDPKFKSLRYSLLQRKELSGEQVEECLKGLGEEGHHGLGGTRAVHNPNISPETLATISKGRNAIDLCRARGFEAYPSFSWTYIHHTLGVRPNLYPEETVKCPDITDFINENFDDNGKGFLLAMSNSNLSLIELKESYDRL